MESERVMARYRKLYGTLLRLYPKPFRDRFGDGMEQTFNDLCRERQSAGDGLFACALWMFVETSAGIVRERKHAIVMQKKHVIRPAVATALILLLPLLAMQFTDEVAWDLVDFAIGGGLLFGAGLTFELIVRRSGNVAYRAAIGLAVATALFLVWMNLAVGLIGSEGNPANLIYVGVLAVGIIGVIVARLRPQGMARALFATALAQALAPVVALIIWKPQVASVESFAGVFAVNALFVVLFVSSAMLFRRVGATEPGSESPA